MTLVLAETTYDLARRAGVGRRKLRRWLRKQKAAGYPLLADHEPGARYSFWPDDAAALAAQLRAEYP